MRTKRGYPAFQIALVETVQWCLFLLGVLVICDVLHSLGWDK